MISPVRNRKIVKIKPNNRFSIICTKIRGHTIFISINKKIQNVWKRRLNVEISDNRINSGKSIFTRTFTIYFSEVYELII